MLSVSQQRIKRFVDVLFSLIGLLTVFIPLLLLILVASFSTKSFGLFLQKRVGQEARIFTMFKIKTMRKTSSDEFIVTLFGKFLRKSKLDELPQLFNVLIGDMSMVGPRPDVEGYADKLKGNDRVILSIKPGITGPATLMFSDEETVLSKQENPLEYNATVLWPQKIVINKLYVEQWNLMKDFRYMYLTILQVFR